MDNKTYRWYELKWEEGVYHPISEGNEFHIFISFGLGTILQTTVSRQGLVVPDAGWESYLFTKSDKKFKFTIE